MMIDNEMIDAILVSVISSIAVAIILGIIGYLVFRNNQKNKNVAVDVRFISVDKDITKNDERIRKEFDEQNQRNDDSFKSIMSEVKEIHDLQIVDRQKILITEVAMENFKETMDKVDDKLDKVLNALLNKKTSD